MHTDMFTFSRAFAALLLAGLLVLAGCDSSDSGMDDQQTQEPSVERSVTFNTQALDLTAGDTELRLANVTASRGDTLVVTTDNGDGNFDDETVVATRPVASDLGGDEVLVDVGQDASPVDHAAHVSTDGTISGVEASSQTAAVYAINQFQWADEAYDGPVGAVTVDAIEVLYQGNVGAKTLSIDLHTGNSSSGQVGAFIGISERDLAVNEVHENVALDVLEPVDPNDDSPQQVFDTIEETGDFFAMIHRGPAGLAPNPNLAGPGAAAGTPPFLGDADGYRVPAQQPALATTTGPGTGGDFANVEVNVPDVRLSDLPTTTYEATIEGSQITDDARGSAPGAIPTSETSTGSGTAELEFVVRDGEIQLDYTITLQGLNFDKVLRGSKNANASSQDLNKLIGLHLHTNVRGRLGPVSFAVVGQGDPQTTVTRGVELSNGDLVNTSHLIASNVPASRPNRAIGFNPGIAAEGLTGDSDRTLTYDSANNELTIEGTWTREEGDAEGLSSARAPAGDASIEPAGGIEFVTTPAQMAQRIVDQNIQPGGDTPFSLNHHTAENLNGEMRGQIVATQ